VIDKTRNEAQAIEYAALVAGQFINEQVSNGNGTDLSRWTPEAYHCLIECAITAFVERMQELKGVPDAA